MWNFLDEGAIPSTSNCPYEVNKLGIGVVLITKALFVRKISATSTISFFRLSIVSRGYVKTDVTPFVIGTSNPS